MLKSRFLPVATALVGISVFAVATQVRAGGDLVKFPDAFEKGVMFTTVDRADNKQYREFYTSPAAIEAAKKGQPLPSGTVITMLQYKAKLGADGNPEKGTDGRFIKGDVNGYAVMEKRTGWGAEYPNEDPQRRVGVSGLHAGQGGQRQRQADRLLPMPQAAAVRTGLRVPVQQDGREISAAYVSNFPNSKFRPGAESNSARV